MIWEVKDYLGLYGALLSTATVFVGALRWMFKERVRLATSYSWTGKEGEADEITIANLSDVPIHVSAYELAWKRRFLRFDKKPIDVTPWDGRTGPFKIEHRSFLALGWSESEKFDWSWRTSNGRKLVLTLHLFGRRPKHLVITRGSLFSK